MNLESIGSTVRERREALGLTQARLAQLAGLSRQTLVGLESGTLRDLGFNRLGQVMAILGLDMAPAAASLRQKGRGLWMAAKTASVSYADELLPQQLARTLARGDVPPRFEAHLAHLLDEAPLPIVVMAIEEAAEREQVPPRMVWRNVGKLAKALEVHRQHMWA